MSSDDSPDKEKIQAREKEQMKEEIETGKGAA